MVSTSLNANKQIIAKDQEEAVEKQQPLINVLLHTLIRVVKVEVLLVYCYG